MMLLTSILVTTAYASENEGDTNITELEQLGVAQGPALQAYFQALKVLEVGDESTYPEGYGGSYINESNELVFQIKTGYEELSDELYKAIDTDLPVLFNTCEYSLNELLEMSDSLLRLADVDINANVIFDIENNTVEIEIFDDNKQIESQLKSVVIDSDLPISLEVSDITQEKAGFGSDDISVDEMYVESNGEIVPLATSSITLYGGSTIFQRNSSTSYTAIGTLGFSGTYSSTTSYITAGHVATDGVYVRSSDVINNYITYTKAKTVNGSSGDYGIVQLSSSSYSIGKSSSIYVSSSTTGSVSYYYYVSDLLPSGTNIYKYGISTGLTVGVYYVGVSYTYTGSSVSYGNLAAFGPVGSSTICAKGDSGGPVWCLYGNYRTLLGVISGYENSSAGTTSKVYYQPIKAIVSAGFTPYGLTKLSSTAFD